MKVWPFGVALRGVMSNRLKLRWLKTVVVSVGEKAQVDASGGDREGERERTADDVSKQAADIRTGSVKWVRDEPGGSPFTGQAVSGMEAGASPVCGFCMERGKADADTAALAPEGRWGATGSAPYGGNRRR
jgi:hypothetical protein